MWGFFAFLILLIAGVFIWASGEIRRRDAMPSEELEKLEAEEDYGPINENLECIFCHSRDCVRTRAITAHIGSPATVFCEDNLRMTRWEIGPFRRAARMVAIEMTLKADYIRAHCIRCGNTWEMFPPEKTNPV